MRSIPILSRAVIFFLFFNINFLSIFTSFSRTIEAGWVDFSPESRKKRKKKLRATRCEDLWSSAESACEVCGVVDFQCQSHWGVCRERVKDGQQLLQNCQCTRQDLHDSVWRIVGVHETKVRRLHNQIRKKFWVFIWAQSVKCLHLSPSGKSFHHIAYRHSLSPPIIIKKMREREKKNI